MDKVIGIDLGTTNSAVAIVDPFTGKGECIMNKEGSTLTASAVCFKDRDELMIGNMARDCKVIYPETATLFKRIIGVEKTAITVHGVDYSPQAVSALVLKSLKADAEEEVGETIHKAVITVPAYFDSNRRKATIEAGALAGFDEVQLLDEPVAAVYAADTIKNYAGKTVLVFDLGGGTLDLACCRITEDTINEVVINGDIHLGGSDWSEAFVSYIKSSKVLQGEILDIESEQELVNKAEQAKIALSRKEETSFTVMTGNGRKEIAVTRDEFESCTVHLLAKAMNILDETKKNLEGKGVSQIDQIIFCGGATRMPQIISGIKKIYPNVSIYEKDVDQAVAKGAAIYASLLNEKQMEIQKDQLSGTIERSDGSELKVKCLKCVTSRSYGILAYVGESEEKISNMILQNKELPTAKVKTYYTKYNNQKEVALRVYESTLPDSHVDKEKGTLLGKCYLEIKGSLPMDSPITVEMNLDENGTLFIRGSEESGKTEVSTRLETNALLSQDELVKERSQVEDVFVKVE